MSKTVRRVHFNSKRRFFTHYWECFSEQEVRESDYIKDHQYHGDNYYTKSCKDLKQFFKNVVDREMRREFRDLERKILLDLDAAEELVGLDKPRSIKWMLH